MIREDTSDLYSASKWLDNLTVCEFIVLANGTMVENPENQRSIPVSTSQSETPQQDFGQKQEPLTGKCLGLVHSPTFCRLVQGLL
jgi:hypothetical protein